MAITINTNMASLVAQQSLNKATSGMDKAMERLSTGLRINSSKDDAAGSAVVTKLDYKISSLAVAQDNAQMGSSLLDTSEGTLDVIQSNLQRVRDLTEQASNGTYGSDAMIAVKAEIKGRLSEVSRISNSTEFNGKNLLDGSLTNGINLQVGINSDDNSKINLGSSLFAKADAESLLGDYEITGDGKGNIETFTSDEDDVARIGEDFYTVTSGVLAEITDETALATAKEDYADETVTKADSTATYKFETGTTDASNVVNNLDNIFGNDVTAQALLDNVDSALADVTSRKTEIGATQQRIASAMEVTSVMSTNLTSASSLIKDADIAEESSSYIKNQILQQTASTLLATANQNPSIALSLV